MMNEVDSSCLVERMNWGYWALGFGAEGMAVLAKLILDHKVSLGTAELAQRLLMWSILLWIDAKGAGQL